MQRILVLGPPTHHRCLLLITAIFAYSLSVSLSAPVSSSSAALFGGGVEISDSYARSIVFAPVDVKEEEVVTTTTTSTPVVELTDKPDLLADKNETNTTTVEKNGDVNDTNRTTTFEKNAPIDQESASTVEKTQSEVLVKLTDAIPSTTVNASSTPLAPTTERTTTKLESSSASPVDSVSSTEASIKETSSITKDVAVDLVKKGEAAPEFVTKVYHIDDSQTSTVIVTERVPTTKKYEEHSSTHVVESKESEYVSSSTDSTSSTTQKSDDNTTESIRTDKSINENEKSSETLPTQDVTKEKVGDVTEVETKVNYTDGLQTTTSGTPITKEQSTTKAVSSEMESSTEALLKLEEKTEKVVEYVPEFVTRTYYLDDSQTSTTASPNVKDQSSTQAVSAEVESSTETLWILEERTETVVNYVPDFVTKTYYIGGSQTSTVIVTERIPTTKKYEDHSTTDASIIESKVTSTTPDTPHILANNEDVSTVSRSDVTTEKLFLKPGEVIILPSGKVLTGVEELKEDIRMTLKSFDSHSASSNTEPKALDVVTFTNSTDEQSTTKLEAVTEPSTSPVSLVTGSSTTNVDENISSTTLKQVETSSTSTTEKTIEVTTTENSIHQTIQLKTSELVANKVDQTTDKATESTPTTQPPIKAEEKRTEETHSLEKHESTSLKPATDAVKEYAVTDSSLVSVKQDTEATKEGLRSEEKKVQSSEDDLIQTTTEVSSHNPSSTSERISTTLKNTVIIHEKEEEKTTLPTTDEVTSTTVQPITESPIIEEPRESKILNETDEVTTLQWTTERNINWTLETSSTTISSTSLSTEAVTTTDSSDLLTATQNDNSSVDTTEPSVLTTTTTTEEGVRRINLRPETNDSKSNSLTLKQELVSNDGVKSTLTINVKPVTDASTSDSDEDESLEVDVVTKPEEEIKICTSDICRKEGEESSKENEP